MTHNTMEAHRLTKLGFLVALLFTCALHPFPSASATGRTTFLCPASPEAKATLKSLPSEVLSNRTSSGYQFHRATLAGIAPNLVGGATSVNRGVIFIPEEGVAAEAYVPYAIRAASGGQWAVVVNRPKSTLISAVIVQNPQILTWSIVAHGIKAGAVAAHLVVALYPKVTGIALLGSVLPGDVDLADSNVAVFLYFGNTDSIVPPSSLAKFASRLPGDTFVSPPLNASHYDFAYTTCGGNKPAVGTALLNRTAEIATALQSTLSLVFYVFQPWAPPSPRALTFSDNEKLTPGNLDSKPYPLKDIRVTFSKQLIPGLTTADPARSWFIFTPSLIKGGLIYFPGAGVGIESYFPIAFEIAARGHLVVLVQQQGRFALPLGLADPDIVIGKGTFPGVKHWAVGAHSVGGRTATGYAALQEASGNPTRKVYAVVLHAGAVSGNLSASTLPVIQIFGTLDQFNPPEQTYRFRLLKSAAQGGIGLLLNANATEFDEVAGADHPQVGEYGSPGIATICSQQEQFKFAQKTARFLDKHVPK